jgi:hypothetical protein
LADVVLVSDINMLLSSETSLRGAKPACCGMDCFASLAMTAIVSV